MSIVDIPRATSAGGVIISARLQMALLDAYQRPVSCPGDPAGRITSEYFRPSTGNASMNSLSSLLSGSTATRPSTTGSVEECHASTKIQSIMRMKKANIYTWNPDGGLAAEKYVRNIQRIVRGFIVRMQIYYKRQEYEYAAAVRIQSVYRGQLGRFHAMDIRIEKKHNALILLQCAWRVSIACGRVHVLRKYKRNMHSTKIQAWWRGKKIRHVLCPNPLQLRKTRFSMQKAMVRKHIGQVETKKLEKKKRKLIEKRMKEAATHNLIVTSKRRRNRNRKPNKNNNKRYPGRDRNNRNRPTFEKVESIPMNPAALLMEVLLYHAIDSCRNEQKVRKVFKPNVPFVHRMGSRTITGGVLPSSQASPLLPANQESASFLRVAIVHALSSQGTSDVVGSALATLQDISAAAKTARTARTRRQQENIQNKPRAKNEANEMKKTSKRHTKSPPKQLKVPKMAYTNVIRDYYHANVLQHPNDMEGLRHLLTALMVGTETNWHDVFECGTLHPKTDGTMAVGQDLYDRLTRMSIRLLTGAKKAVEFRKQSRINARKAAAEPSDVRRDTALESKVDELLPPPQGTRKSLEAKQLQLAELVVDLLHDWFFAALKTLNGGTSFMTDVDTGAVVNVHRRGTWVVVDGHLPIHNHRNEIIQLPLESFVFSQLELDLLVGQNKKDTEIIQQLMCHVKIVRVGNGEDGTGHCSDGGHGGSGIDGDKPNILTVTTAENTQTFPRMRVVVVPVERRRVFLRYTRKRKAAAIVVQRFYQGRRLLNAMHRRVALYQRSRADHAALLNSIVAKHEKAHAHHVHLVDKVKAAFIARRQRKQLRDLHAKAKKIQRVMRLYIAWLRDEEQKAWEKYGAQVRTVYDRPKLVSGKALEVRIQRAGKNWMLRGIDHSVGEIYQGLLKEQQILALIKKYPYGRDQGYSIKRRKRLYVSEHPRVLLLILSTLAMTDAIDGLGELNGFDGKRTLICSLLFGNKASGPSILSRLGQRRLLNDTKDAVPTTKNEKAIKRMNKNEKEKEEQKMTT